MGARGVVGQARKLYIGNLPLDMDVTEQVSPPPPSGKQWPGSPRNMVKRPESPRIVATWPESPQNRGEIGPPAAVFLTSVSRPIDAQTMRDFFTTAMLAAFPELRDVGPAGTTPVEAVRHQPSVPR